MTAADDATRPAATVINADDATVVARSESGAPLAVVGPGTTLKQRFVLGELLGRGGMGSVYRARDLRREEAGDPNPWIALKLITGEFSRDARAFVALQRETDKSQTLAHPNVVKVYDFDRDGDIFYMTMEWLRGQSLDRLLAAGDGAGLAQAEACRLIREIAGGVAYAHQRGIVHSDLKPANVFVTADGEVRILDFGIARAFAGLRAPRTADRDEIVGLTPAYASREMFEGQEPHPADDVYALGLVAYELLTGRHPFARRPARELEPATARPQRIRGLKGYQWRALARALQLQRDRRQPNAGEFLRQFSGSGRTVRLLGSGLAASLLLLGGLLLFYQPQPGPEIPFEQLSPQLQQQVTDHLRDGREALRFKDYNGALFYFDQAYALHPRNPEAVAELQQVVDQLLAALAQQQPPPDAATRLEAIDELLKYESLARNSTLLEERKRLQALLP